MAKSQNSNGKVAFIDPYIRVRNVGRSVDWYKRMLGFKVGMAMPEKKKPAFVRLHVDGPNGAALMVGDGSNPMSGRKVPKAIAEALAARKAQKVVSFYYRVDKGIDDLFRSVRRKKAKVVLPIQDMDYGMREFTIRDPDGYEVSVGQGM
jgi:uncharacterized glyoxalase superfamily protein PhnB